ncbi:MAG: type II secretion system minor pseudopilin GspK [Pseudomonadota bacterium]|nr:MAG: type II secretion system minor pseudopilin GspK [Pseudomonadota bacterium]
MHRCSGSRQDGSALLLALVAAALAAVLAVGLVERAQRSLARTEALVAAERGWQYARGMDEIAVALLRRARSEGIDPALLDGAWSQPFEVPGGVVQGRLIDQNARFNVNALAHPDGATAAAAQAAFRRLLDALGLDRIIADELADWLDGASVPSPGSAATNWYSRRDPPYRTAGVVLANTSELRWLRSVDHEAWLALAPLVSALPEPELVVNVNTTSPEVLAALLPALEPGQARRVLTDKPFSDLPAFERHPLVAPVMRPDVRRHLTVSSRWYLAQARVVLDEVTRDYFRLMIPEVPGYDGFRYVSQGVP